MPRIKNHNFVTFNDGILQICELSERKIVKTKMDRVRYGDMTVGIKRFWDAKVAGNDIEKTVAIPKIPDISRMDLILINGKQYKIEQIQDKFDQIKWFDSMKEGRDMCGTYEFCSCCKKEPTYPCARAAHRYQSG